MTPRLETDVVNAELLQDDTIENVLCHNKVPHKSARNFLLCVARSPAIQVLQAAEEIKPDEIGNRVIH